MCLIGYSHIQKGNRWFDLVHHKFCTSCDVTFFFESVSYFAPSGSPSRTQHVITSRYPKKEIVPKPLQVYITGSKIVAPTSLPTNPVPIIADPILLSNSTPMITDPPPLRLRRSPLLLLI